MTRLARRAALLVALLGAADCRRAEELGAGPGEGAPPATKHVSHAPPGPTSGGLPPGMAEVDVPFERRQITGIRTAEVAVRPLAREIRTVGLVVADERRVRRIQTKVSGWVEELYVSFTGEPVKAGDPVLALYSPELVASQREYLLARETFGDGSRTGLDETARRGLLQDARRRLELLDVGPSQLAALERSREATRRVVLCSPIAGFVTFKPVLQGTYVTPDMELYTVADLARVWVWADVSEDEIPLVAVGQEATIEVPAATTAHRAGRVAFLEPTLDVATRSLRVRFDVDNADGTLRPGMYATVRIERPLGDVLALPEEAVIDTGVRQVVFVEVAAGRFQPREVSLGRKGGDAYEVLAGLGAGERVAVSAQFLLDSESRLRGVSAPAHGAHSP